MQLCVSRSGMSSREWPDSSGASSTTSIMAERLSEEGLMWAVRRWIATAGTEEELDRVLESARSSVPHPDISNLEGRRCASPLCAGVGAID